MKSVLMIAYFFPPDGSAGSYRPLRFVRRLSQLGWRSSVISADRYYHERYDVELVRQVPDETEVFRVCGRDPWQAFQAKRTQQVQNILSQASTEIAANICSAHY